MAGFSINQSGITPSTGVPAQPSGTTPASTGIGSLMVGTAAGTFAVIPGPTAPNQVPTSGDPALGQLPSWQAPPVAPVPPTLINAGNLGATYTLDLSSGPNPYLAVVTATLTANCAITVIGLAQGLLAVAEFTQDATGGRTLSINGTAVGVLPDAGSVSQITIVSPDGAKVITQGPSLLGAKYLITSTNATWPVPPGATALEVLCVGGGGQGGGGGTNAAGAANAGGGAGGAGTTISKVVNVGANTSLNVTIGAGGSAAGGGGAAGGNAGTAGSQGGSTTVTATGISVTAYGGSGGAGGPASATTSAQGGTTPNGGGNPQTGTAAVPGAGGASGASPNSGYIGNGYQGSGGGAGGPSNTTNGGVGGGAGAQGAGGTAGTTFTGSANGGNGTAAAANSASGGGGGGGAPSGGTGGNGGAGGSGYALITVTDLTGVALPIPQPGGNLIWDGRVASATQVANYPGALNGGPTLSNYGSVQAGLTNPTNNALANYRVWALSAFGTAGATGGSGISARTRNVIRLRNWNTDTNNKNTGQQKNPASAIASPFVLGNYATNPNSNWNAYYGFSLGFPSGNATNGFPAGDNPFPVVPTFFQVFEDFGQPFGSPVWSLTVRNGQFIPSQGQPAGLTSGVNYLEFGTGSMGAMWVLSAPLQYDFWYDIVIHAGRSTAASADGGTTGGFLELWVNGTQQVFLPGASEGGPTFSNWTRVNSGKKMIVATLNSGDSGSGYVNLDSYRNVSQFAGEGTALSPANASGIDPVTHYVYPVGIGTTFASADPSVN